MVMACGKRRAFCGLGGGLPWLLNEYKEHLQARKTQKPEKPYQTLTLNPK